MVDFVNVQFFHNPLSMVNNRLLFDLNINGKNKNERNKKKIFAFQ